MFASKHWIAALATLAFLVASGLGVHVHLCFDGQEPGSTVHVLDDDHLDHHLGHGQDAHDHDHDHDHDHGHGHGQGHDHEQRQGKTHNDIDVDVAGQALAKASSQYVPMLAVLSAWVLPISLDSHTFTLRRPARRVPDVDKPPRFWRPLLRAPPL
jgi:hypothetical protein